MNPSVPSQCLSSLFNLSDEPACEPWPHFLCALSPSCNSTVYGDKQTTKGWQPSLAVAAPVLLLPACHCWVSRSRDQSWSRDQSQDQQSVISMLLILILIQISDLLFSNFFAWDQLKISIIIAQQKSMPDLTTDCPKQKSQSDFQHQ